LGVVEQVYAHGIVVLHGFSGRCLTRPASSLPCGWFTREASDELPMPEATRRLLAKVGWTREDP